MSIFLYPTPGKGSALHSFSRKLRKLTDVGQRHAVIQRKRDLPELGTYDLFFLLQLVLSKQKECDETAAKDIIISLPSCLQQHGRSSAESLGQPIDVPRGLLVVA